jgi:L-threonylcarbamoyladenylate synthase
VLDGGVCPRGIESTIVRPCGNVLEILRPGALASAELQRVWPGQVAYIAKPEVAVPGSAPRHYAPRTLTVLAERSALAAAGADTAVIALEPAPPAASAGRVVLLPRIPGEYAARLYATLRELDAGGFARILIERVPDDEHWLALANRLGRAACPE